MRLDDLALGQLRHVFEADRIAVFEGGELHAVDEMGDEVRPAITSGISWRADTQEWRPIWTPGVVYEAPAALWRQLVLEAKQQSPGSAGEATGATRGPPSGSYTPEAVTTGTVPDSHAGAVHANGTNPWISTAEAARRLDIDRSNLDRVAAAAHGARPDLVMRVGSGERHRTYKWRADAIAEALAAGRAALPQPPTRSKPNRKGRRPTKPARGKLRGLVD